MRSLIPDVDDLYDPDLPATLNITRIVSGEASHDLEARRRQGSSLTQRASEPRQQETMLPPTTARDTRTNTEFQAIVRALRRPATHEPQSPLLALQQQLSNVFKHGPLRAGGIFTSLSVAAESGLTTAQTPDSDVAIPWNSCKAAATLVGLLACPPARLFEVLKFQSQRLNGMPTLDIIRNTPSASLQSAFRNAKALARGDKGSSSVIVVSLIDVHMFELAGQGRSKGYTSFAHTFVLGVGPEGVVVWQGWGEHGYGLDKWIMDGGSRVRTWQEAGDFVDVFENFASYKVGHLFFFC